MDALCRVLQLNVDVAYLNGGRDDLVDFIKFRNASDNDASLVLLYRYASRGPSTHTPNWWFAQGQDITISLQRVSPGYSLRFGIMLSDYHYDSCDIYFPRPFTEVHLCEKNLRESNLCQWLLKTDYTETVSHGSQRVTVLTIVSGEAVVVWTCVIVTVRAILIRVVSVIYRLDITVTVKWGGQSVFVGI
jgi:hypothetical protein